jgi:hypothetical protein
VSKTRAAACNKEWKNVRTRLRISSLGDRPTLARQSVSAESPDHPALAESFSMTTTPNIARVSAFHGSTMRRISLSRPRWTNLGLAASLVIFWAGVFLKIFG